ncbi:hypothetical protein M404DRAFT_169533, partial [Pisolithus tinctorius Marx 270]
LPNFIGHYFPQCDDPDESSFYCVCMLMLFKPWRNVKTDLKQPSQCCEAALDNFLLTAPAQIHQFISGIQYFHECKSSAV